MIDDAIAKSASAATKLFWNRVAEGEVERAREDSSESPSVLVLVGDPRSTELAADDSNRDLLEFILNHEEVVFFLEERAFHICRDHTQAKAIFKRGEIPARFRCTLRGEACPMRAISRAASESKVVIRCR